MATGTYRYAAYATIATIAMKRINLRRALPCSFFVCAFGGFIVVSERDRLISISSSRGLRRSQAGAQGFAQQPGWNLAAVDDSRTSNFFQENPFDPSSY